MRARILAIVILLIFLIFPVSLYWYLTTQKISTLEVTISGGSNYTVELIGTFGLDGLPLADKVLKYEKTCASTSCIISPILPAKYNLMLTSSGKVTIKENIAINAGENLSKSYNLLKDISVIFQKNISENPERISQLIDSARNNNIGVFYPIGIDLNQKLWVWRSIDGGAQIGILTSEKFSPIKNTNTPIEKASIDATRSVLVIHFGNNRILLFATDLSDEKEIVFSDSQFIQSVVPGKNWKIRTQNGLYELRTDRFIEDIRFTDSIDLSQDIRIGYISSVDSKKLSTGNFESNKSPLILLNRKTGSSTILRDNFNIVAFFYFDKKPAYIDTGGNIFVIEL